MDHDLGGMSVTSNAENVLEEISKYIDLNRPIIYLDSDENWDGVRFLVDGEVQFYPLNTKSLNVAIKKARDIWKEKHGKYISPTKLT